MKIILLFLFWTGLTGCSHLLYYPSRVLYVDSKKLKPVPEEVSFNEEQTKLTGWHFAAQNPKAILVVFHGNAQNISSHFATMYWSVEKNLDLFIFDYPGYGGSHGEPTPTSTVQSGLAAIKYVEARWPDRPIVIVGQSLGGAIALKTLIDLPTAKNICAAVIDSSFLSYKEVARKIMAKNWFTWPFQYLTYLLLSDSQAPANKLDRLPPIPFLVTHRRHDAIIPFELGEDLYQHLPHNKQFLPLDGDGHVNAFTGPDRVETRKELLNFLKVCWNEPQAKL